MRNRVDNCIFGVSYAGCKTRAPLDNTRPDDKRPRQAIGSLERWMGQGGPVNDKKNWLIYGANGFTGRLIAAEAKRQGLAPVLAGGVPPIV